VAGAGDGLVPASPKGPVVDVVTVAAWGGQHGGGQQVLQFGAAERDQFGRVVGGGVVLEQRGDDQEGVGGQGSGRPVVPRGPGADPSLVEAAGALGE